ncbi:radical SAM protein [Streptomonospora sp. PA3]|uniref:intein-containing Rv2578c family radical SAM protein n=1 Tax=Streptomonospora sp. PA3 TaxID=2607326 RepID=UPI0012DEABB0|nr:intein-containing Rv2578c family radical SAM protein [Streptomonospora sp. PA3]MUL41693.1 radical SAM protein [Streptomonospora sp. PA3]
MRWETLRDQHDEPALFERAAVAPEPERGTGRAGLAAPGPGPVLAGDDGGAVAVEIRARSVINRVPGESAVPFRWTINPYRGCSHACVYCLSGDTPILLADGRTRPLADIRAGDRIYGTRREGSYRRYTPTTVLAHWVTVKRAYRITLADGTTLTASGDHRFLTGRGWKYVTGGTSGRHRRPHLTEGIGLMGTGHYAAPPENSAAYRQGYLCGIIRGDAHHGEYSYRRAGRSAAASRMFRFRLALADDEALDRAAGYLADFGVSTDRFDFSPATANRRPMAAIRNSQRASFERISEITQWPVAPCDEWRKGFLAGIFDAEGSCSQGVLRISNTDPEIITAILLSLKHFGFEHTLEFRATAPGMQIVRLTGGLRERLRFFHTTDPAITRKRRIDDVALKSEAPLDVVSIEDTGEERTLYDITTGTGDFLANGVVSHNCFARRTHEYLDLDSGRDFDTKIMVKVNAGELLRRELADPRWSGEPIAMGTNTDPYQRAEGRYRLMPQIIAALRDFANPFSILTKGRLILRDLDLLEEAARVTDVGLAVSVGSLDEAVWRSVEPGTPRPAARLDVVRRCADRGLDCSVLMAPILPGLTDSAEQIEATVAAIAEAGATSLTPILLHLRPGAREWYMQWLAREHPRLVPRYRDLYRRGAYAPKPYRDLVSARVRDAARRHGLLRPGGDDIPRHRPAPPEAPAAPGTRGEQLSLLQP